MLKVVTSSAIMNELQAALQARLLDSLNGIGKLKIGFPGGNMTLEVFAEDESAGLWYAYSSPNADDRTPRHWNGFGFLDRSAGMQNISVEVNIPSRSYTGRVRGYFAVDANGSAHLMHSGGVGGGKEGVGQTAFLNWSELPLEVASLGAGRSRKGILVGKLDDPAFVTNLRRFVSTVRDFKQYVRDRNRP